VQEIGTIAEYLSDRADIGLDKDQALILLGDFNIVSPQHKTMQALLKHKFKVPQALRFKTNVAETKHYDQIAFKTKRNVVEYIDSGSDDPHERNAGLFRLFGSTYRTSQIDDYKAAMRKTSNFASSKYSRDYAKYFRDWRTYQLSDHNPLWVRLRVNESESYLQQLREG
jgi:endonuclease/exonuclease/phosphatase family metal-dependent hydrolase